MAPEIADVQSGESIASEWGDSLRDRTVQRYADAAERTTEHPSPAQGDLSFLADDQTVWVFSASGWVNIARPVQAADVAGGVASGFEVDNSTEVNGPTNLGTSLVDVASVTLSIPAGWGSWKCFAYASYVIQAGAAGSGDITETRIRIDGTDQQLKVHSVTADENFTDDGSVGGRRTGMTTTGNRSVSLRARSQTAGATESIRDIFLYARAVRTS